MPMYTDSAVQAIGPDGSIRIVREGQDLTLTGFDNVILAGGMQAVNGLAGELDGMVDSLKLVGDAVAVRTVLEAIEEGYEAALSV